MIRLRYLLIITFVLLSSIPAILGFQFVTTYTENQFRMQVEGQLSALSLIAKKRVIDVMDRIEDTTLLIASRTQMRLSLRAWSQTKGPEHLTKINQILVDANSDMARITGITLFDQNGRFVTTTFAGNDTRPVVDVLERGNSIQLINGEETALSSVKRLYLHGDLIGFVEIIFSAEFLLDLVRDRTGLGTSGEWAFAFRNADGDAVFAVPLKQDQNAAFQRIVPRNRLDVPVTQALLGSEVIMRNAPDYMGTLVIASTRYIATRDWGLVVKIDEAEVSEMAQGAQRYLFIGLIVLILFGVLISMIISQFIASPVEKLRREVERLADGDFNVKPIESGWKEVMEFSASFSRMTCAVKDLSDHLNHKVQERTRALDEANQKLHELATRDGLTGLFNRRHFTERFEQEFDRAKRYNSELTFAMLDIDHFKQINDTWGHAAGDKVLIGIGEFLKNTIRESDIVGRIGGEEFGIVLMSGKESGVLTVVERLRMELARQVHVCEGKKLTATCSVGIAYLTPDIKDIASMFKQADEALYLAKEDGRNRVVLYEQYKLKTVK